MCSMHLHNGVHCTWIDVFEVDSDVIITVVAAVFMVEADSVHQLVDGCAHVDAAVDVKRDALFASYLTHV